MLAVSGVMSIVRTRLASPWRIYSEPCSIRGGFEGSSHPGMWLGCYIYIYPGCCVAGISKACVMWWSASYFSPFYISCLFMDRVRLDMRGTIKRKHSCWSFCCLLLRSVCEHTSTHLLLLQNKTETKPDKWIFLFFVRQDNLVDKSFEAVSGHSVYFNESDKYCQVTKWPRSSI